MFPIFSFSFNSCVFLCAKHQKKSPFALLERTRFSGSFFELVPYFSTCTILIIFFSAHIPYRLADQLITGNLIDQFVDSGLYFSCQELHHYLCCPISNVMKRKLYGSKGWFIVAGKFPVIISNHGKIFRNPKSQLISTSYTPPAIRSFIQKTAVISCFNSFSTHS